MLSVTAVLVNTILYFYSSCVIVVELVWVSLRCLIATILAIYRVVIKPAKKPLNGEIILITGAAHGVGRELALEFARRGGHLVLWDINEIGLKKTVTDIENANGEADCYKCDITDRDAVKQTALRIRKEIGDVTILVNNAGIFYTKHFEEFAPENIRKTMEVNVMAHFWTIQEFLPKMLEMDRGHIVAMCSVCGKFGSSDTVPYTTSKFAVTGMMEGLGEELRRYNKTNIVLTTVYPFILNTGLVKYPKIKYPLFFSITEPDVAAQKIIDGVQRNDEHVYIPFLWEILSRVGPLMPRSVQKILLDFTEMGVSMQPD